MSDETLVPQHEESAEQDDYESAFAEFSEAEGTADVGEQTTNESDSEEATESEAVPETENDPLAGFNENQRKIVEELKRKADEAEHTAKSQIGRVSALTRKLNELSQAKSQVSNQPDAAPLPGDPDWEQFKADFPEMSNAVEKRLASIEKSLTERVGQVAQPIHQMQREQFLRSQFAALEAAHPDYQSVAGSNEFRSWLATQPPQVQQMIGSEDAAEASWLLSTYKSLAVKTPQGPSDVVALREKRKAQLQQSAGVPAKGSSNQSIGGAPDDYEAAFQFFANRKSR
jgi:hypothetical protein